ncbi:MAG TPA: dihydroorotase [Hyphomicrobiales bacterium]|nr:dihydroorotase [Hyphomicrobiales bacterium]
MAEHRPFLLAKARLVDPAGGTEEDGGLLVRAGQIAALGPELRADAVGPDVEIVDCEGLVVAPGLVDMRAFVGEPGAEHRETIATASQAAAAGGVTTVVCMPETDPPIDAPAIVDFLLRRARDTAVVRVHPSAAITKGLQGRELTEIGLLQEAGAVAFTDGASTIASARVLRRALTYARDFGALVVHHVEDADLAGDGVMNEGEFASRLGLAGRSAAAETITLERDLRLAALSGGRYHAAILTCAASVEAMREARARGLAASCGTSINHLSFNETDVGDYRTFFKLAPPLRAEDDRKALVAALAEGVIDVIVSDHNPQDAEQKRQPFAEAADGAVGLETMLPAALRLVHAGDVALPALLRAMSTRPAELLGLPGGRLARGAAADLVVFDLDAPWQLRPEMLRSKSKNTPFDEARLQGRVRRTYVGGSLVHLETADD